MVGIVTGTSLGLGRTSVAQLGSQGQLGDSTFGVDGENVFVNAANGNLVIDRTDSVLTGVGREDDVSLSYNSLAASTGYGASNGWQTNDSRSVYGLTGTVDTTGSTVSRVDADGTVSVYTWNATDSAYVTTEAGQAADRITFSSGSNQWTWTDGDTQATEIYDASNSGRIVSSTDANGNTLTYTYSGSLLTQVTDADGEYTAFTYSGGNLASITTYYFANAAAFASNTLSTLSNVSYTYDSYNRLSTVTVQTPGDLTGGTGGTVVTTYGYQGSTDLITSISQTGGAELTIGYTAGQVSSVQQTVASGVTNTTSFSYGSGSTQITDNAGNVTTLSFDTLGELTEMQLPPAQSGATAQTMYYTYNSDGDVLTATDALGNVTTYTYDSNDNLLTVTDPVGNVTTYTYDTNNHVLTATTANGSQTSTTRYVYDSNENLRFTLDGDGQVTQYLYNTAGEQTSAISYTNDLYNLSGLTSSQSPSLSTMTSWASGLSDLANTQRVDTTYDYRGNVATVTSYSAVNSSGVGLTTSPYTVETYVYDPSGRLLSKQTSGVANSEVYTYDALGRVLTATNLEGGTTTYQYNNSTNTTTETDPNGLTVTSVYNLAGQLLSVADSGAGVTSGTTSYAYDSRGNLAMVTDADGNTSYFLYDAVGRKVADVAADGSITRYQYNADDQLVATTAYATKLTSGQLSSLVSSGVPVDPALSTVLPSSSSGDVWTWRIFDADNRLIETINGDGDATVNTYDTFSNVTSTTSYANVLSSSALSGFKTTTPTTLQLPTADPGADDVTRAFYNNEGQVIATLDGNGYLTQTFYDDAGDMIETLASANAVASGYRASGTLSQLQTSAGTSSHDIATYFVYDSEGNLRYTLNANLTPTEYDYDDAGHLVETIEYAGSIASSSSYTVASVQSAITTAGLASSTSNRTGFSVYDTTTGNLDYTIDAMGDVTQYRYDAQGNVIKVTQFATLDSVSSLPSQATMDSWASAHPTSSDRITRTFYNAANQVVYTVDGEGYVTLFSYDAAGHLTGTIQYGSQYTVTDSTTLTGLATLIGSPSSSTYVQTSYSYDIDGRITDTYDGLGNDTHVTYDAQGRVSTSTVAYGTSAASVTAYTYDAANNVASVTQASGTSIAATTSYTYDGMGHVLTMTDPDGHATTYTYDALGDVLTTTDPTGAVTTNTYDAFGNMLTSTDALGNTSYFFYDLLDRLTLAIDPMGYATATTYGFGNEIASVTHCATPYTGTITAGSPPSISWSSADATTTFARDNLGRVTSTMDAIGYATSDPTGHTQSETYDAFGDVVTRTNQLGGMTTYTYDQRGLMLSETLPETSTTASGTVEATTVTNTYTYDARGNMTQMVEASGLTEQRITNYTYDALNRLLTTTLVANTGQTFQITANNLSTTSVSSITTATNHYDDNGNLIETVDANGAETFNYYDALNRKIATVNAVGTLSEWTYDENGNVTAATVYGDAVTLPTSPGGSPPSPVNPSNYRQTTYTYDHDNRVLTSTIASVLIGSYSGTAYGTSTSSITTTNVYDADGNLIEQTDPNGNSTFTYYDKSDRKVAQVDPDKYLTVWTLDSNGNVTNETRYATKLTMTVATSSTVSALQSNAGTSSNDRTTGFTYDLNGNRLTESRLYVAANTIDSSGHLTPSTVTSTITYTYNGLGEVTSQTQATGDATTYTYDSMGRQTQVQLTPYTGSGGSTVKTTTDEYYDGLNDLTASAVFDADNLSTPAEVTTFTYGAGGRLATMTEGVTATMSGGLPTSYNTSNAFTRTYGYDADGNTIMSSYSRLKSNGTTVTEADVTNYDLLGRQTLQSVATYSGSTWTLGDKYQTSYDVYGEVASRSINSVTQSTNTYNNAGQLLSTTANNGSEQMYIYDADGNQTLEIDSSGVALPTGYSWSTLTLAQAITILTNSGANAIGAVDPTSKGFIVTFTTYDARSQATSNIEPFRELSLSGSTYTTATETTSSVYDAFGDVVQSTDANGNVTNYTYSTLGKVLQQQLPSVSHTAQNGGVSSAHPTTTYYYDISGRQIGVTDANGNQTTQSLLANTGYEGGQSSVLKTFDPDGGISSNGYDVFGNVITQTNQDSEVITNAYNALNQLVEVTYPAVAANSTTGQTAVQLIDYYAYDGLGQRIQSWNSQLGSSDKATTDYDSEGRIIKQVDLDGYTTSTSYTWSSTASTSGLGTFGGWVKATTNSAGMTSSETDDSFGREIALDDFSGFTTTYTFDLAGRLSTAYENWDNDTTTTFTYYNTGKVASESDTYRVENHRHRGSSFTVSWTNYTLAETFAYDGNGNRTAETTSQNIYNGIMGINTTTSYENATATWDALNRMTSLSDSGNNAAAPMTLNYYYDLNGNVVEQVATYRALNTSTGAPATSSTTQTEWFSYDSMNRETIYDGTFTGSPGSGTIGAGSTGTAVTYDAAGNRMTSTVASVATAYTYTNAGSLAEITTGGVKAATYVTDAMGRDTAQSDYNSAGTSVVYSKTDTYDADSNITSDVVTSVQSSNTYVQDDTYSYVVQSGYSNLLDGGTGAYQGGSVTNEATSTYKNGTFQVASDLETEYMYLDTQMLNETYYTPNTAAPTTQYTTGYVYNWNQLLTGASINDGSPRTVAYVLNLQDEILSSLNSRGPASDYYFFDGNQEGEISNNGTQDTTNAASIAQLTTTPGTGFFTNGAATGTASAQFGTTLQGINAFGNQTVTAPTYTVQAGDTLESIAQELWGDSSYWYLLADANGITDDSQLIVGENLTIPEVVAPSQNNATTNTVYNQSQAIGNIAPTHPPIPSSHHSGCGVLGEILEVIVAIVVTIVTEGAAAEALGSVLGEGTSAIGLGTTAVGAAGSVDIAATAAAGAIGGAIGDAAGQVFGLATGMQSKFSWSQVGLGAIGGAVNAGIAASGAFNGLTTTLGSFGAGFVEGAAANALTQGIGVATGLQSKFDWAGVAGAGIGQGIGAELGAGTPGNTPFQNELDSGVGGMAGAIASAAIRTVSNGSDFGDNLIRYLPQAIGQTIGGLVTADVMSPTTFTDGGQTIQYTPSSSPPQPVTVAEDPGDWIGSAPLGPPVEVEELPPPSTAAGSAPTDSDFGGGSPTKLGPNTQEAALNGSAGVTPVNAQNLQDLPNNPGFKIDPKTGTIYVYDGTNYSPLTLSSTDADTGETGYTSADGKTVYTRGPNGVLVESVTVTGPQTPEPIQIWIHYYPIQDAKGYAYHAFVELRASGNRHFFISAGPLAGSQRLGVWAGSNPANSIYAGIGENGLPVPQQEAYQVGSLSTYSWSQATAALANDAMDVNQENLLYDPSGLIGYNSNSVAFTEVARFASDVTYDSSPFSLYYGHEVNMYKGHYFPGAADSVLDRQQMPLP